MLDLQTLVSRELDPLESLQFLDRARHAAHEVPGIELDDFHASPFPRVRHGHGHLQLTIAVHFRPIQAQAFVGERRVAQAEPEREQRSIGRIGVMRPEDVLLAAS